MDYDLLMLLAQRARAKFRGRYPNGVVASDCLQDCVVMILELEQQLTTRLPAGVSRDAWLVTRCHGDLKDRYARQWKRDTDIRVIGPVNPASAADPGPSAEEDFDRKEDIAEAFKGLKPIEQTVMRLTLEGLTQSEIAKKIGHTQPSVSQIIARAKKKLVEKLEAYDV